jgi:hypothetical protein
MGKTWKLRWRPPDISVDIRRQGIKVRVSGLPMPGHTAIGGLTVYTSIGRMIPEKKVDSRGSPDEGSEGVSSVIAIELVSMLS